MSELKIEMQEKTNNGYDTLYPQTTSEQVKLTTARLISVSSDSAVSGLEPFMALQQSGTYSGDNTSGLANANTIRFDFEPKFVYIFDSEAGYNYGRYIFVIIPRLTNSYAQYGYYFQPSYYSGAYDKCYAKYDSGAKELSWYYSDNSASQQFNQSRTYKWIAIG